jgi:hypothetical protein
MDVIRPLPRLHRITIGGFQAYLWRDDDPATLVDTPGPRAPAR